MQHFDIESEGHVESNNKESDQTFGTSIAPQIYIVDNMHLKKKCLDEQFYTDQLLAKTKYLEGNTEALIYTIINSTVAYIFTKRS